MSHKLWSLFDFVTLQSIEEKAGDNVIGCLWEIDLATIDDLDEQEGVSQNIYQPMEVTVVRGSGKSFQETIFRIFVTLNVQTDLLWSAVHTKRLA